MESGKREREGKKRAQQNRGNRERRNKKSDEKFAREKNGGVMGFRVKHGNTEGE